MKSSVYRIFPFILGFVLSLSSISCKDDSSENDKPGKLTTPVLTLSEADGTLSAEWTAVENASGYEVLAEQGNADGTFEKLARNVVTETSASWTDIRPNTPYRVTVTAKGDGRKWLDSDPATQSWQTAMQLAAPQPAVSEVGLGKASLAWNAVESATAYAYTIRSGDETLFSGETTQTEVVVDHLMANTTYTFSIRALANEGAVTSEAGAVEFTTDNMTFDIEISEITYNRARFEVTPSTDKYSYFSGILTDSSVASLSDEEIVKWLEEQKAANDAILGRDVVYGKEVTRYVLGLAAESEYFIVAFGYDYDETTQTGYASTPVTKAAFTTAEEPEASNKYLAWLGTWEVTSSGSKITNQPLKFTIEISKRSINASYNITGWGITEHGAKQSLEAQLNDMTGMIHITTCQQGENYELDGVEYPTYTVAFIDGDQFITGGAGSTIFEGQVAGNYGVFNSYPIFVSDRNYYPEGFDYMVMTTDGMWHDLPAREGFTDRDYPTAPFRLTRISESTGAAPQSQPHVVKAAAAPTAAPVARVNGR